jgi:hypothetical protein
MLGSENRRSLIWSTEEGAAGLHSKPAPAQPGVVAPAPMIVAACAGRR